MLATWFCFPAYALLRAVSMTQCGLHPKPSHSVRNYKETDLRPVILYTMSQICLSDKSACPQPCKFQILSGLFEYTETGG